ncbi:NAD(P)H-dependent oxidoreductase [Paraburkholderia caledonica]|uniref:NAD(P)H dehydrogenase (Quinone) n=1 Tax=Paraburkholderia caledonica TaxID=134536 RepID=A0ABU1KZ06_9BURK|nr:NAD(P)H-dependent oxidoreductase [Paraburkholderia caledonica]MDR6376185.1 NAD(P)H dehydrogenase (quinone) [Paraburkholderia caledonica]
MPIAWSANKHIHTRQFNITILDEISNRLCSSEPTSLTGYLKHRAVAALIEAGHEVVVSDLYAMKWKAVADVDDFLSRADSVGKFSYQAESRTAFTSGTQAPEVAEEQRKLLWADAVILQFPIWWYSMPAILKGWIDRIYAYGFAYGVGPQGGLNWGKRFGEGVLEGRRAMVTMTVGGRMSHYGPRGVNGAIDDILWPIHHGALFYAGMQVVPPTVFYEAGRADAVAVEQMAETYIRNLLNISVTSPIPFRAQNGGDYDDVQVLKENLNPGVTGHALHRREPAYISNTWFGQAGDYTRRHIAPDSRYDEK